MSTPPPEQIEAYIQEYKQLEQSYKQLSKVVRKELSKILKESGVKYLKVQRRVKTADSLRKKLEDPNKSTPIHSVTELSDLAGCRVILYHDYEINPLVEKIYAKESFNILKDGDLKYSREGYNSLHIDVSLKDQSPISENELLEHEIKCEIQITTAQYHLWAESAHDMIYKAPEYETEHDKQQHQKFVEWFQDEARDSIKKQLEMDEMSILWKNFQKGIRIISNENLQKISKLKSNNEISSEMERLCEYIEAFGNRNPEGINFVDYLREIMSQANYNFKDNDEEIAYFKDIYSSCVRILRRLVKKNTEVNLALDELFILARDSNENIQSEAERALLDVIKYQPDRQGRLDNLEKQIHISREIITLSGEVLAENILLIIKIHGRLLSNSCEYSETVDPRTVRFRSGHLPEINYIKDIREVVIQSQMKAFNHTPSSDVKKLIIESLGNNVIGHDITPLASKWKGIITQNIKTILNLYEKIAGDSEHTFEYEVLFSIEKKIYWISYHYGQDNFPVIEKIRRSLAENIGQRIYKACFNTGAMGHSEMSSDRGDTRIKDELLQLVQGISTNNQSTYLSVISYLGDRYSSDPNQLKHLEYEYVFYFMNQIGRHQLEFAKKLISEGHSVPFNAAMLHGMCGSGHKEYANQVVREWISNGTLLHQCIEFLDRTKNIDLKMMSNIYEQSRDSDEHNVLLHLFHFIIKSYKSSGVGKDIAKNCIKKFNLQKDHLWISHGHPNWIASFLSDFDELDWLDIFDGFVTLPNLDEETSRRILGLLFEKFPNLFVKLFKERITYSKRLNLDSGFTGYTAVPYRRKNLSAKLDPEKSRVVVDELLRLAEEERNNHRVYADILAFVFPRFDQVLETALLDNTVIQKNTAFIIEIVKRYNGAEFTHAICKQLIRKVSNMEEYEHSLINALCGTFFHGSGFRSIAIFYQKRIDQVQTWLEHDDESIQTFAEACIDRLEKLLSAEEKRADQISHQAFGELSDENEQDDESHRDDEPEQGNEPSKDGKSEQDDESEQDDQDK